MKTKLLKCFMFGFAFCFLLTFNVSNVSATPAVISYQGYFEEDGLPYTGTIYLKFVITNANENNSLWSNDGTSVAGSEPEDSASTTATSGLFSIVLGGDDTDPISDKTIFSTGSVRRLNVWASTDDITFTDLGNEIMTAAPYAICADTVVNNTVPYMTLDADNTGTAINCGIIANQGSSQDGTIRYNASSNQWEISNNGGAYSAIGTGGGDITSVGSVTSGAAFSDSASAHGQWIGIGASSGRMVFYNKPTDEINFLNCQVGIGTTSPGYDLEVNNASTHAVVEIDSADGSNSSIRLSDGNVLNWNIWTLGTNGRLLITDADESAGVYIAQNATSWSAFSDIRLKENIEELDNTLEKVLSLRAVRFNFLHNDRTEIGLIAQEVEPFFPEIVDTDGDYWGLNYDRVGPILIEAIKEQQEEIENLEDRVLELEEKLLELYDMLERR